MACISSTGCVASYWCDTVNYLGYGSVCIISQPLSAYCYDTTRGCGTGLYCDTISSNQCRTLVAIGGACTSNIACVSGTCDLSGTMTCITSTCYNGVLDTGETAIDCGGTVHRMHTLL